VEVVNNAEKEQFEVINEDGTQLGVLCYYYDENTMGMYHTKVNPAFEGLGVGSKLARAALNFARDNEYKVSPDCPFVKAYIDKHEEYQDLVG
jgi:predicted GNAT family acetyltransferase